jgi:putative solute:sodium symporter small subunit
VADLSQEAKEAHWAKTRNLTMLVLALWVLFGIIVPWLAQPLNAMSFLGFPLGYYMCVQGSLIIFVLLIVYQNWRQDTIDDEYGVGD